MTSGTENATAGATDKAFIVAIALGPVGRFIAGGRRSRDLWYGSRLLSELTRQAANSLHENGSTTLYVPLPETLYCDYWSKPHQGPVIPNKILALVKAKDAEQVRDDLDRARKAVLDFLAEEVRKLAEDEKWKIGVDRSALQAQADAIEGGDFVEFYAAWAPLSGDEPAAVERARDVLLAGRKAARVFPAPSWTKPGRPKCSLDPGRDSVMVEENPRAKPRESTRLMMDREQRGIRRDERLDAIGLLRRRAVFEEVVETNRADDGKLCLPKLPFPPLARVAADPWLEGAAANSRHLLEAIVDELKRLDEGRGDRNPLLLISSPCREPAKALDENGPFPYDPSLLFENGIQTMRRELDRRRKSLGNDDPSDGEYLEPCKKAASALREMERPVRQLHDLFGFPSPYYAMLEADGDDMGHLLGELTGERRTRAVEALGEFARHAWDEIDGCHGFAFYVGGDELTAYLPVDKALELVGALSGLFTAEMRASKVWKHDSCPTLSAGVVIAHQKEDMRAVRDRASAALKRAKRHRKHERDRSSTDPSVQGESGWVCIEERPAGGTARTLVGPIDRIRNEQAEWGQLIARAGNDRDLSLATAHGLLEWADRFRTNEAGSGDLGIALAQASVWQRLKRRDQDRGELRWLQRFLAARSWAEIRDYANAILLADRIADIAAQRQPLGRRTR
ncbi:CRISPR-associated protein Cas10/Cmr2, subtype III-B [Thioflavicoccus mobilis 8321]|uniref:CRISPR-associated protein Cas10/Cmr2, subtype III-B n=2 Tax=Thioflavicoccus mobilis TaxID=80679 RepID=L0GR16_9GAMM|nr:type III-B CRISPR-associated protein Cas10/Cmr2 [Thioflavicoccus mobilis]AGA89188.1 CRISPR-associated protein Cas10/Cmr2, subtype III-B [Thioflavicoccus mobilis 8321]